MQAKTSCSKRQVQMPQLCPTQVQLQPRLDPEEFIQHTVCVRETDPATLEEEKASAVEQPVELSAAEKERADAGETLKILERLICERKERLTRCQYDSKSLDTTIIDATKWLFYYYQQDCRLFMPRSGLCPTWSSVSRLHCPGSEPLSFPWVFP